MSAAKRKSFTITGKDLLVERRHTAIDRSAEPDEMVVSGEDPICSDGYHDFKDLYKHRYQLFICLLNEMAKDPLRDVWKSKHHSDCTLPAYLAGCMDGVPLIRGGACCSMFDGFFVCGIGFKPGEQITYHLPLKRWDEVRAQKIEKAPPYDGHTAADVLERLRRL